VITKCQHYFCEQCALKHHQRNPRCFVCEVPTNGLFNVAKDIIKKMKADKLKDK
jgi:RING finger protein 113A